MFLTISNVLMCYRCFKTPVTLRSAPAGESRSVLPICLASHSPEGLSESGQLANNRQRYSAEYGREGESHTSYPLHEKEIKEVMQPSITYPGDDEDGAENRRRMFEA